MTSSAARLRDLDGTERYPDPERAFVAAWEEAEGLARAALASHPTAAPLVTLRGRPRAGGAATVFCAETRTRDATVCVLDVSPLAALRGLVARLRAQGATS